MNWIVRYGRTLHWTGRRGGGVAIPSTVQNGERVELLKKSLVSSSADIGECKPPLELLCNATLRIKKSGAP
jgi:hypothetical protein